MINQGHTKSSIDKISGLKLQNKDLDSILDTHPYFQLGLVEKSRRLRKENHIDAIKYARKCAILFPDRSLLYKLIHEQEENKAELAKSNVDTAPKKIEVKQEEIEQIEKPESSTKEIENVPEEHKGKVDSTLEKEYLIEAINQSIQIEMDSYEIEKEFIEKAKKEEKAKKPALEEGNVEILSFSDWLKNDSEREGLEPTFNSDLIEKFIQESPNISKIQEKSFYSPIEKGKESLSDSYLPYSETLASIFVKQGNKELAIKAYTHLMLKNPQKSVYFADLIKKLEEKI